MNARLFRAGGTALVVLLFVVSGRFSACTRGDPITSPLGYSGGVLEQVHPGQTTLAELGREFGEPLRVGSASLPPEVYEFHSGAGFQVHVDGGSVVAATRAPASEEAHLQYWRHRWKGYEQDFSPLGGENRKGLYQLRAPGLGMAVIYDPGRDQVIRVVKYDSH